MKRFIGLFLAAVLLLTGCTAKPAEPQPPTSSETTEPLTTQATQTPPTETQPTETQPTETQPTESQPTESQPADPQPTVSTEETLPTPPQGLILSEVMADNKLLSLGHDQDWVELYYSGDAALSLDGFYLTDDLAKPHQLSLEEKTISPDGYLVIELGEAAPFHLSAQGETLYLMYGTEVYEQVTFGASENGESFSATGPCSYVTPGYADTKEGYQAALEARTLPEIIISEVLSSNSRFKAPDGGCHDLIEIQNISDHSVSLAGYTLSDKRSEPDRYTFPDVTLESGGFYVIYCSGEPSLGKNHTTFKLSADGETVYLSKNGVFTDAVSVPGDLGKNESYGRSGKTFTYFPTPTPGKANGQGAPVGLSSPAASHPSGIYSKAVTVTLEAEGTIYYTTDGSRPTTASSIYTAPLQITGVTTLRTFCVSGTRTSASTAYTYAVGANHDLPVVCVAIPQDCLTGEEGILNHIETNYEYEAMLTLIEDGEEKFSVPFGFRLHGNDSRKMPKQNFQLRFRSQYGAGKLKYPLFENRDIEEFHSLLLKGGSEDWFSTVLRDEFCTGLVDEGTALYTQAIKPVVLYLGGSYWGIYYLRERISDDYVASHLGVSPESVDMLESNAAQIQCGSDQDFKALREYVKTHDMTQQEHYDYLASRIDVLSLMDWYICRSFVGDIDLANIRRFRSQEADGKWHWAYFDLDWAMYRPDERAISKTLKHSGGDPQLINALLQNPQGQDLFLLRCDELFDTVLSEEHFLQVLEDLVSQIRSEIPADRERWDRSVSKWEKEIQKLRDFVKDGRRVAILQEDLRDYFHLTKEDMQKYFG